MEKIIPLLLSSSNSCVLDAQLCPTLCNPMDYSPARFLCPWDFSGKNTGVGCHFLFQGIFPTQRSNPHLPALAGGFFTTEPPGKLCYFPRRTHCSTFVRFSQSMNVFVFRA